MPAISDKGSAGVCSRHSFYLFLLNDLHEYVSCYLSSELLDVQYRRLTHSRVGCAVALTKQPIEFLKDLQVVLEQLHTNYEKVEVLGSLKFRESANRCRVPQPRKRKPLTLSTRLKRLVEGIESAPSDR